MPIPSSIIDATLREPYGEAAYGIVERLSDAGYDTWWVGGCVRDMLLGTVPHDIDIATAAHPSNIVALFPRSKEIANALGSVRVRKGPFVFEVTTFRKETQISDGRKPAAVTFGTREEDAVRRDFTMNALYFHPISRSLFDPFNGEADGREHLVRFIGDPSERIRHDALRSLRAIRFRARIAGQYHPETYAAMREQASLVGRLSGTRLLEELEKLLLTNNAHRGLEDEWELGILEHTFPDLYKCKGIPQPADFHREGDVWDHTLRCVRAFREDDLPDVRLATLFHDAGKAQTYSLRGRIRFDEHATVSAEIAEREFMRMGMPAKRRGKIRWLIEHHMTMQPLLDMQEDRKAHWYHHPWFPEILQIFWLDIAGTEPSDFALYDRIVADYNRFLDAHPRPLSPLLTGEEIMEAAGMSSGKEIGALMEELRREQLNGVIVTKRDALARLHALRQRGGGGA